MQRVPPHNLEAERAVLGSLLLKNATLDVVLDLLKPEDFYSEANARIYQQMSTMHATREPIDTVTLGAALEKAGMLQGVGGMQYLMDLTDTIPTSENTRAHAKIIVEKALVRRLIDASQGIAAKGYGDYGETQEYVDWTEKQIFEICSKRSQSVSEHIRDLIVQSFEEIEAMAKAGERISGLRTGFAKLDDKTAGMHPGDLIIVAGRPGMGKTAFALNVAVNACHSRHKTGQPEAVAIFSLEMPKKQLAKRMLSSEARVDSGRMRTSLLTNDDWQSLAYSAGILSDLPIWIDDKPAMSMVDLRSIARRMMSERKLCLIVIDYLQLMRSGTKNDSREQEISEISRGLKGLAKELEIPIMALSQLNRGVESRSNKDKRPQLSDLRESGAIEQDADTIMFVYRDEVYNAETLDQGLAEIIIGKQRAGPTGTVKVRFFNQYTRFENLAEQDEPADALGE